MKEISVERLLDLVEAGVLPNEDVRERLRGNRIGYDDALRAVRLGVLSPAKAREGFGLSDLSKVDIWLPHHLRAKDEAKEEAPEKAGQRDDAALAASIGWHVARLSGCKKMPPLAEYVEKARVSTPQPFWQPIEDHHKDGRKLLLREGGKVWIGHYVSSEHFDHGVSQGKREYWTSAGNWVISLDKPRPTHCAEIPPLDE